MNSKFIFIDKEAEKDDFLGVKKEKVKELADAPEPEDDDGDGEGASDGGEKSKEGETYENIEDMDIFIAKVLLSLIDDTRATWLSTYAYGDIDNTDKYRYYSDLDAKNHKPLVMAMAYIVRKYRLSKSPEVIVIIALATSTYFLYTMARADKKAHQEEKEEKARKEAEKKQQQQPKVQETGKIIKMEKQKPKFQAL